MSPDGSKPRAVVDSNVFIRGTLSSRGASARLLQALKQGHFTLITSLHHLTEVYEVLGRPRITRKYHITPRQRKRLIARLYTFSTFVRPVGRLALCRDPEDDYLLEMALAGQATHLVTEDDDLHDDADIVEFLRRRGVQLVRAAKFLASPHT